ncbi:MAG: signal recognition particle-docking protein FtsY [Actinobacteria bacterium]|nr:signal recognition particle-docking protein FtsY [Actinomycetota bacterium]MBV9663221.1 signal recognition particle-docking protein FtsY [Actinomycetota bacterium]MBV9934334.1 signal recognition particle-docking protein FtsY [Actinomycetota bacterium]
MTLVIVIAVLALIMIVSAAVVTRRGRGGVELEPPPAPPRERPPLRPPARPQQPAPPRPLEEVEDLTPERVAEVEEALRGVEAPAEEAIPLPEEEAPVVPEEAPEVLAPPVKPRFRDRLGKARSLLSGYVGSVLSRSTIDDDTWDELEEALIRADVGVGPTTALLDQLRARVKAEGITSPAQLIEALKEDLKKTLATGDRELRFETGGGPNVWLFVGVNGVGKTTTIGKVGQREAANGRHIVMAAGDTFRAAAGEQLELWARRVEADLVRGAEGADPGSVVFDAVERAAARKADLVLADTAGRLHTKVNLMEELKKVRRIAERPPALLTEVLLVIDATTGQNGLVQAKQFTDAVGVTGVVLTKLDGTAKGGIALAIQTEMGIPIKLVGLGESADDLVDFDPDEFVEALFSED